VSLTVTAPPTLTTITGPTGPIALGGAATIGAQFSDPATGDAHTCQFVWDDGAQTGPAAATSGACSASHTYAAPGVYEVAVTVTDDDGLSATGSFQYVVVYDPTAGFVTGGGWVQSAPGSYVADPALAGKASFGFVSRYKRGQSVPTGETQFQFEVANFRFQSVAYQWLVISGARAQYKGVGTVNGAGSYGFLLTATDGQVTGGGGVDRFRIKVWQVTSGAVVYDNVLGTTDTLTGANPQALGGGSVVIHAK